MQYHYEVLTFLAYLLTLAALAYCSYQIGRTKGTSMDDLWSKDEDIIQDDLEPGCQPLFIFEGDGWKSLEAGDPGQVLVQVADSNASNDVETAAEAILRLNANPPVPSRELKKCLVPFPFPSREEMEYIAKALEAGSYSPSPKDLKPGASLKLEPFPHIINPWFNEKNFKKVKKAKARPKKVAKKPKAKKKV